MTEQEFWLETNSGVRLWTRKWSPNEQIKAVVNIVHGMSEHSLRYREFAEFLCDHGVEVWCADQRGHGKTADTSVNDEKEGGLLGHCADKKGFHKVLQDIDIVHRTIKKEHKNLPLIILGHSWGSFLTQGYIELFNGRISGAILSGTRGPGGPGIKLAAVFLQLLAAACGGRTRSSFVNTLVFGAYNKPFEPSKTPNDWLTRDESAVDAYLADPLCGKLPTIGFFRDMICGIQQIHRSRSIEKINRSLPVYILSGSKDPVGGMGKAVGALVKKYNSRLKNLTFVLYPGARHECLHEINRCEVMRNILTWLEKFF